jgi:CBS domain-containing membrane protein
VAAAGWLFPIIPVGLNAVILTVAAMVFHRFSQHSYPHHAPAPAVAAPDAPLPHPEDLDAALAELGETFDITREDLDRLFESVRAHANRRKQQR